MKLAFQIAYKNLIGAGLRTWLNAIVLSFAFVVIIFINGLLDGWNQQARRDNIAWEYGQGQIIHRDYDPSDPFTLQDAHSRIPANNDGLTPILMRQATVYPQGRMMSITLKGIAIDQTTLSLPTSKLDVIDAAIPAIIGKRMADAANVRSGDQVLLRWRDKNGTFDAQHITIVHVFDANVPMIDQGQIWISIEKMWELTGMQGEATMLVASKEKEYDFPNWRYESQEELLTELSSLIETKQASSSIMYLFLLGIALLAIFDTQVLSIFRRQKEIGTYIALGMTRWQVVRVFTVEGSMYSLFAIMLGSVYGLPILWFVSAVGVGMPEASQNMGVSLADKIYPVYGFTLITVTSLLMVISATVVSFLPARGIAKMDPIKAIKGKLQ